MNSVFVFQYLVHDAIELGVAVAVVAWLAQDWKTKSDARIARCIVGNRSIWLPIVLAALPPILGMLVGLPLSRLLVSTPWHPAALVIVYILNMFYGVLVGMASAACATPVDAGGRTRLGPPIAVCVALIFLPMVLLWFGPFPLTFSVMLRVFLAAIIIATSRLLLGDLGVPAAAGSAAPGAAAKPASRALLIGFAPSALALTLLPLGSVLHLSNSDQNSLLWLLCAVSIVCCFVASGMLFARRTGAAVLGGILFLLLNGFIAFFFGCCASIKF